MSNSEGQPDLSWLADAPVFIDGQQIGAFYDAVVGPAFRTVELQVSVGKTEQLQKSVGARLVAGLPALFPWLKLHGELDAELATTSGQQQGSNIVLQPVESAARQLVELSFHYLVNQPGRICAAGNGSPLPDSERIGESPRMLAFVDVGPGAIFLPQAAELSDGRVVTFFEPLVEALQRDGGNSPGPYPDSTTSVEGQRDRDAYWSWFVSNWNVDKAVKVVENEIGDGGRPRWIDYRTTLDTGDSLHLHVVGRGEYDTGVFAYNLVRRGQRYGLRIVGSLKSQPALNVLAIYEK